MGKLQKHPPHITRQLLLLPSVRENNAVFPLVKEDIRARDDSRHLLIQAFSSPAISQQSLPDTCNWKTFCSGQVILVTVLPALVITLAVIATFQHSPFLRVNVYRYQRLIRADTDMVLVILTVMCGYRPYCSRQLVSHRHTGRTSFFQLCYPRTMFFSQQYFRSYPMDKQCPEVGITTLAYQRQAKFASGTGLFRHRPDIHSKLGFKR